MEIRSWSTSYRGDLLITASKLPKHPPYPNGVMICIVELTDIRPFINSDTEMAHIPFTPNLFAWVLNNPRPVIQSPIKGKLGIFNISNELIEHPKQPMPSHDAIIARAE